MKVKKLPQRDLDFKIDIYYLTEDSFLRSYH